MKLLVYIHFRLQVGVDAHTCTCYSCRPRYRPDGVDHLIYSAYVHRRHCRQTKTTRRATAIHSPYTDEFEYRYNRPAGLSTTGRWGRFENTSLRVRIACYHTDDVGRLCEIESGGPYISPPKDIRAENAQLYEQRASEPSPHSSV